MKKTVKKQSTAKKAEPATSTPDRFDPVNTVEKVITEALKTSAVKMGFNSTKALIACLKEGNCTAFNYYHYNIAKELGRVLGSWDKNIRAVYTHVFDGATPEEACNESESPFCPVYMIVWSERKTKALDALVELLDRSIAQYQREILGIVNLERVLDVQLVDDDDVKNRTGYAALIKSIYQPPIAVWTNNLSVL
ncbi:MAG: hypothetical protein PHU23_18880 [Dehalococcoidales bacterium]|nr:hypothetical protein [Dehalococcoidales bacterium]